MKIALLHPFFTTRGGGERKLFLIADNFAKKGHKVKIFCHKLDRRNCFPEYNKNLDFVVVPYGKSIFGKLSAILKLVRKLKNYDVVQAQNIPSYLEAGLSKRFYGNKVIWFCNDFPIHYDYYNKQNPSAYLSLKRIVEKFLTKKIDLVVTNSRAVKKAVAKDLKKKSKIIYSGIDTSFFKPKKIKKDKEVIIFTTGRLVKYKNFDLVIRSFKDIQQKIGGEIKLYIAGEGDERKNLENLAKGNEKIIFLGNISQEKLLHYYNLCDIFVLASKAEPLGVTPMEAMACEKPVISFNSGGPRDVVLHKKTGFLANNESEFNEYLVSLINNKKLREKMGSRGRKRVQNLFTTENMLNEVDKIYQELLEK